MKEKERSEAMRKIIEDLHRGVPFEEAKRRFDTLVRDVTPEQIAQMEQQLIREGMPASEIQRLCDLHVGVVRKGLEQQGELKAPPGHPVHTYMAENQIISALANRLGEFLARLGEPPDPARFAELRPQLWGLIHKLGGLDGHFVRKENQLFPFLERHGITGPPKVMWGVHDEIRSMLKAIEKAIEGSRAKEVAEKGAALSRAVTEMVFKENRILLPMAMSTLSDDEWAEARRGEDELGYAFANPAADWPAAAVSGGAGALGPATAAGGRPGAAAPAGAVGKEAAARGLSDMLNLKTGQLSLEQVDLMLRHLPVDVSFVDADGFVRYYSDSPERIFPRSPGVIGRHVELCHPPSSVDKVKEIVNAFKSGQKDVAEFWIQMQGRFIHIRYFAVRDSGRKYLGTLEVSQDVTEIRKLEGERRLVQWVS